MREELLHWAARGVMNIEGLGDAMVAQLLGQSAELATMQKLVTEEGAPVVTRKPLIHTIGGSVPSEARRFAWAWNAWARRLRMRCWRRSSDRKRRGWRACCWGWGSGFVGERTAQLLAAHFGSMDELEKAASQSPDKAAEALEAVTEVGPKVAQAIVEFFAVEKNKDLVRDLAIVGSEDDGGEAGDDFDAGGAYVCADGDAAESYARGGEGEDRVGRWAGFGQREQEDEIMWLRERRRGRSWIRRRRWA